MKTIIISCVLFCLNVSAVKAQDSTSSAKIDSLLILQKMLVEQQGKIYDEVVRYNEPLEGKSIGIEFNPAYFLSGISKSYTVLSGGISFFAIDRNAEIACPFFYQNGTTDKSNTSELLLWNHDVLYRKFLGQHQKGFYIEGGFRYTHIRGEEENGISFLGINLGSTSSPVITTDKLGAMFGIGVRIFSTSGLYWGASVKYGAYFSSDERGIKGVFPDNTKTIIDFEILKFGFAF